MPPTIKEFQRRGVLQHRALPSEPTKRFVSWKRARESFDEFWEVYHPLRRGCPNPKKPARLKFEAAVRRGVDTAEILRGARNYAVWVAGNVRDPHYVAMAQTWLNQERWTDHLDEPVSTVDQVVAGLFNGNSWVLANAFRSDILVRARALDFGDVGEVDLAIKLGKLHEAIKSARSLRPPLSDVPGPLDLLRRYVMWLAERADWQNKMTTRVLWADSPAFQQFRREVAARHPRGVDPLTGR